MISVLSKVDLRLTDGDCSLAQAHGDEIAQYWAELSSKNGRLWNGAFYMFEGVTILNGTMSGLGHQTDFAGFLYWRDHGRHASITHITGTSMPCFEDGSLLAIKMANHTANAGKIYFPAGSFDSSDIVADNFDVHSNVRRELKEELNIELDNAWVTGPMLASFAENSYHIALPFELPMDFATLSKSWTAFREAGGDDEIDSLVRIGGVHEIPLEMPTYAAALCRYHFAGLKD